MNTQIVSTTIDIKQAGAYQHFEIRIPISTQKIVGVECGVRLISEATLITMKEATLTKPQIEEIGELRLHCANDYQWFYACMLTDLVYKNDKHTHYSDSQDMLKPFLYHGKHEADTCDVKPNTTRIKGFFKDVLGTNHQVNFQYQITISIHLETN